MAFAFEHVDPYHAIRTCAWCDKTIPENAERFSLGAYAKPGFPLAMLAGKAVRLKLMLSGRKITAIIPVNDSDAKRAGNDFIFTICCEKCGKSLRAAIEREKDIFKFPGMN